MSKGIISTGSLYVDHLNPSSEADIKAVSDFYVSNELAKGLERYLKMCAFDDEENNEMRTYLVRLVKTDECVGYFSLKAGLISLNERITDSYNKETGEQTKIRDFDTLPGVELANFAVNSAFIDAHPKLKGIGYVMFSEFILPIVYGTAGSVGVKLLYIFSLPHDSLMKRYIEYGFKRLDETSESDLHKRIKPHYDRDCTFMYMII